MLDNAGEKNPMYGKHLSCCMELSAYQKMIDTLAEKNRQRAKDLAWHKKMSEVTSGKNNPMYGHSIFEYMTDDEIKEWKKKLHIAMSGKNNPMYGKSSWEKCTLEERAARIKNIVKV